MNIYIYNNNFIELIYFKSILNTNTNKNKIILKKLYGYFVKANKKFIYLKIKNNKSTITFKINKKARNLNIFNIISNI